MPPSVISPQKPGFHLMFKWVFHLIFHYSNYSGPEALAHSVNNASTIFSVPSFPVMAGNLALTSS